VRILLIEDDSMVADFVSKGLSEAGHQVLHAGDGLKGLDYALNESFDLAICDLMLPECDGLSIIEQMRQAQIKTPVIILSAKRSVDDRVLGLRRGGDDYLTKPFSELLARVEALARRAADTNSSTELEIDDLHMDLLARKVTRNGQRVDLQPREFALLEYLLRNAGHVVSKTTIMERVWNYNFDPGTNVVEARISKLREKIDQRQARPLIHTVRGAGYVLRPSHDSPS
jgi:two-component system OmpR family response regulator